MVTDDQRWVGLHRLPVRDLLKNLELLEHDGALVARQAALNELTKGGINCTRVRRGFFRTVARLCNLESTAPAAAQVAHDAVVAGERTVVAAADLARAPIQPDDLDSFVKVLPAAARRDRGAAGADQDWDDRYSRRTSSCSPSRTPTRVRSSPPLQVARLRRRSAAL